LPRDVIGQSRKNINVTHLVAIGGGSLAILRSTVRSHKTRGYRRRRKIGKPGKNVLC
jgi:hypothetical protein